MFINSRQHYASRKKMICIKNNYKPKNTSSINHVILKSSHYTLNYGSYCITNKKRSNSLFRYYQQLYLVLGTKHIIID